MIPFVNNIQSAGPFQDFDRRYQITNSEIWSKERTLDNFNYKINPHSVIKEGVLYRQAEIRSSHWKPAWVVLTSTGYLHCFKLNMDKKVIRMHTIKKQGSGSNIVEEGQKAYNDLKKPETYFSLKIGYNMKCVPLKSKRGSYCFEIVIDNSSTNSTNPKDYNAAAEEIKRKKSLFGGGSNNNKKNILFSLRADTQEIYDSWLDKISAQAERASFSTSALVNVPSTKSMSEPSSQTESMEKPETETSPLSSPPTSPLSSPLSSPATVPATSAPISPPVSPPASVN